MNDHEPNREILDYRGKPRPNIFPTRSDIITAFVNGMMTGLILGFVAAKLASVYGLIWIAGPVAPGVLIFDLGPPGLLYMLIGGATLWGVYFVVYKITPGKRRPLVIFAIVVFHILGTLSINLLEK
jgi:hypothetical protein